MSILHTVLDIINNEKPKTYANAFDFEADTPVVSTEPKVIYKTTEELEQFYADGTKQRKEKLVKESKRLEKLEVKRQEKAKVAEKKARARLTASGKKDIAKWKAQRVKAEAKVFTETKASQTIIELKKQEEELLAQVVATEEAQKQAELAIQRLDAKKAELQAEKASLQVEQELNVVLEEKIKTIQQTVVLQTKLGAITEVLHKLQAQIRVAQNLERVFTQRQRTELLIRSGGKCQSCGDAVNIDTFEADHIIPYSKGGETVVENGQCLCRNCNRTKSNN